MKTRIVALVAVVLLTLSACGKSKDEQALDSFKAELTQKGYSIVSAKWDVEGSEATKKKAAPKTTQKSTTTKAVSNPKDRFMEVRVVLRGCTWEAERKAGQSGFVIDEAENKAGGEIEDFEAPPNATADQLRAWVDTGNNRELFDCYDKSAA